PVRTPRVSMFRRMFRAPARRHSAANPARFRPHAEPLEDRAVPAAIANQVLVQFQPGVDDAARAAAVGQVNGQLADRLLTGSPDGELDLVTLPAGVAADSAITLLSDLPAVRFAEPNWSLS